MRILLTLFLLLFLSSRSYSNDFICKYFDINCETVSFKKVQEREKKFYKLNSLKPFTGNIVIDLEEFDTVNYLESGEQGKVIDGLKHGEWEDFKIYNKYKEIHSKSIYDRGELKQSSIWEDGFLVVLRNYKNGVLDGKYEEWRSPLSKDLKVPDVQGYYKNGVKVKCWKFLEMINYKNHSNDFYIVKECYNSKYIIDTEIYGEVGGKKPYYSGKKNHHGCYSGDWLQYDKKGKIKEKINLGECTIGFFFPGIEKLFSNPIWSGYDEILN